MGVTGIKTFIAGRGVREPMDWQSNTISATFGTDSSQPQIETDRFEFVLDAAAKIIEHKEKGNIFEPLECEQIYTQGDETYVALKGFLDTSDGYEELDPTWGSVERPNRVLAKFKQDESITHFLEQIQGVTYGSLLSEGVITHQDYTTINTTIVKKANFMEIAMAILAIYMVRSHIEDHIKSIQEAINDIQAIIAGGATGSLAAAIFAIALLAIQIAYAIVLIALTVALVKTLVDLLIPPIVKNKGVKYRTLLEKACIKFGYEFESNIEELDTYHYFPSKQSDGDSSIRSLKDLIPKHEAGLVGIPSIRDYGYLINEMFDLMKSMFNTKVTVIGNKVLMYNAYDPFWETLSDFVPHKSINFSSKKYNTDELSQTRMMTFTTDLNDEWTTQNFKGTSYEIKTSTSSGSTGNIKGLDRIEIPVALPNSKTEPTNIDKIIITLAGWADELANAMGQKSNLKKTVQLNKVNILKVSDNFYAVPKVVPLNGLNVPANHRELVSAKYLMEKYHYGKSFVTDGAIGQKVYYEDIDIPFTLSDLKQTLKSGSFTLSDGRKAEFDTIDYNFSKDTANCNIYVREVYTDKLKETYFEPE